MVIHIKSMPAGGFGHSAGVCPPRTADQLHRVASISGEDNLVAGFDGGRAIGQVVGEIILLRGKYHNHRRAGTLRPPGGRATPQQSRNMVAP